MDAIQPIRGNLYQPRKCSATGKLITSKDHSSVQFNVGEVNAKGLFTGKRKAYAFSGFVRSSGESNSSLERLVREQ